MYGREQKIANVQLVYDNTELLELLKKRGDVIAKDPKKLKKVEDLINSRLEDENKFKKYETPIAAFVTW